MSTDVELSGLPVPAQKALAPDAPRPLRLLAARGVIPGLKPGEIVQVVSVLAGSDDAELAQLAEKTLANMPPPILEGALGQDLPGSVVDRLARVHVNRHEVLEQLLRMPRIGGETLQFLAQSADERSGELIATNERLMLLHPVVIEKLYLNARVRMSTADRLVELAVRHNLELGIPAYKEAAAAINNELIAEPTEEPSFDDLLFVQADQTANAVEPLKEDEDAFELDEEGKEHLRQKFVPLHVLIGQMTITQKIRRATLGSAVERLLLVRDSNRLVSQAAVKSPNMRESEAMQIAASRAVSEDVLRIIAQNREFVRHYQVKLNLVSNPRTPLTFAARLLPHLRDNDVKSLSKSKNVSGAIVQAARQQLTRKLGKKID
jgi:hypothetical protein